MENLQGEKYLWHFRSFPKDSVLKLASTFNIAAPIIQTLLARGYCEAEDIENIIFNHYERNVAHPSLLKDAQKAVDRIISAIANQEKILIFGDYDVDGITSSALMILGLMPLNACVNFFLPHRVRDGYGLSTKIVEQAAQNGYKVIITVDNGITAFEPAACAKKLGIDLIITDHHRPHKEVPDACAIVNPHQEDCTYPFKSFAGVGVTFKVLSLLYEKLNKTLPAKAIELLLLGTIADVVPLTGENRYWVKCGLQQVNQQESLAFSMLKKHGKVVKPSLSSLDIGFSITPQINALGRLEDPRQGVKFLIGSDEKEIERIGTVLYELNQARKELERSILSEIVNHIEKKVIDLDKENIIMVASKTWPPGVIGLVASRLVGMYGKPTLLFHINDQGIAKGSCRSIPAFNMFDALTSCKDLLITFGGHSVAAGLSLSVDNMPVLKEYLEQLLISQLTPHDLLQKIVIDTQVLLTDINQNLVIGMDYLEPFGHGNEQPLFYVQNVVNLQMPQLLKDAHVKLQVFADGMVKPLIFFNRPELFEKIIHHGSNPFDIVVQVSKNYWNERMSIELLGVDIRFT